MKGYYTTQNGCDIVLYRIQPGEDQHQKVFTGSKKEIEEFILLLQKAIKNHVFKFRPESDYE